MEHSIRKRSNSPPRTRHSKRMILLDEQNDDWRRTSSPSTSSVTSKASTDSEATGDLNYVTEKFSGFLADFLAEYASPTSPRSPQPNSVDTSLPPSETRSHVSAVSDVAESPAPSSRRSESQDYTSDSEDGDQDHEDASTVADGESNWEDDDLDTPGSPGSDIELKDGVIRRGMYITVIISNREQSTAMPCVAKVLEVHDRKGKFTLRLSKSARRATRTMFNTSPRSPTAARGRFASPKP